MRTAHRAPPDIVLLRRGTLAGALLIGLLLPRAAHADCTRDVECKGERICQDGKCVDAPSSTSTPPQTSVPPQAPTASPAAEASPGTPSAPTTPVAEQTLAPSPPPLMNGPAQSVPYRPLGRVIVNGFATGQAVFGIGEQPTIVMPMAGFSSGVSLLVGFRPTLADEGGGLWHGLELRILGTLYAGAAFFSNSSAGGVASVAGSGALGYEFIGFRRAESGSQHGTGLFLGATGGVLNTNIFVPSSTIYSGLDPTVGAVASLTFANYSIADRKLARSVLNLSAENLPGTGLWFFGLGFGGTL